MSYCFIKDVLAMEIELVDHFKETNIRVMLASIFDRVPHIHHDIEILMPIQGSLYMEANSRKYHINKDEFFVLSHDVLHSGHQADEPNAFVVLEISPNFCKKFFPRLSKIHLLENHVTKTSNPEFYACLRKAVCETVFYCGKQPEGSELLIMSSLCNLIVGILNYAEYEEYTELEIQSHKRDYMRISSIVNYINSNYMNNISLNDLAEREKLNPSYLSRFISEQLGVSFRDYVNNLRLEKAVTLLTTTNMTKLDICLASGFSDYRYLNSGIQKHFGCSPEDLRAESNPTSLSSRNSHYISKQHHIVDISLGHTKLLNYFKDELSSINFFNLS